MEVALRDELKPRTRVSLRSRAAHTEEKNKSRTLRRVVKCADHGYHEPSIRICFSVAQAA